MSVLSLDWGMILGGFALFMFGIKYMGDGLKAAAGDKLKDFINKYTSNRFSGMLIGILITVIMQSSSATSAITIGFVRAGLMSLEQAAGIILGASIGTTVTSLLISFKIDKYAMFIVFLGGLLICFFKKQKTISMGQVILGFGLIFFGMSAMGDALAALKEMPSFSAIALTMAQNPLMALVTGILLTAAVQSSAATIGVIQKLYDAGAIAFSASLPFMFGANIGTTMTGILASIGGSTAGKRTACLHTLMNIFGTIIGMLLLKPYTAFVQMIAGSMNPMMQIAVANIIFKSVTTMLFFPFTNQLVALTRKIIPGKEPEHLDIDIDEMDEAITDRLPSAAVYAADQAILKMLDLVRVNSSVTMDYFNGNGSEETLETISRNESVVNKFDKKITDYLINLSLKPNLTIKDTADVRIGLDSVKNLERIGDLTMNLSEFFTMLAESGKEVNKFSREEINKMFSVFLDMYDLSAEIMMTRDEQLYEQMQEMEKRLDDMELRYRGHHFKRLAAKEINSPVEESIFCDILGTIERMGDHACNVARASVTGLASDLSDDEVIA